MAKDGIIWAPKDSKCNALNYIKYLKIHEFMTLEQNKSPNQSPSEGKSIHYFRKLVSKEKELNIYLAFTIKNYHWVTVVHMGEGFFPEVFQLTNEEGKIESE